MNLFQLVLKQMRQRALGTWLTTLSVLLGMALAVAILIMKRESAALFAQTDFGYEVLIGPPAGSPLQLTLNTVYHIDQSAGTLPHAVYEDMLRRPPRDGKLPPGRFAYHPMARMAVPIMVGDSVNGRRLIGTSPLFFGANDDGTPREGGGLNYRLDKSFEFAQGRSFKLRRFEAVVGSDTAKALNLKLYDDKLSDEENEKVGGAFRVTHGMPAPGEAPDIHKPYWRIVGILKPTNTANDRVVFVPYITLYAIEEHESGLIEQALLRAGVDPRTVKPGQLDQVLASLGISPDRIPADLKQKFKIASTRPANAIHEDEHEDNDEPFTTDAEGNITPKLPQDQWTISAIMVKGRSAKGVEDLFYNMRVLDGRAAAINPASVMRDFFNTFFKGTTLVLQVISALVLIVAGVGILVSIYNSVSARMKEIAILRALGATRLRILSLICVEAGLIGLLGGLLGLVGGHALMALGSVVTQRVLGQPINWIKSDSIEWQYLIAVVALSVIAGLVPALKAYRTPVATNLVAS